MVATIKSAIQEWDDVCSLNFEYADKDEEKNDIKFSFENLTDTHGT